MSTSFRVKQKAETKDDSFPSDLDRSRQPAARTHGWEASKRQKHAGCGRDGRPRGRQAR
ncbi:hypothetical protein B0T17DRAFT_525380 [Bombardia bombarda]|uniref:Uncharacterized protein n=1 Tax=Bombardia bombarda TaxID=252184 RepID=A0AA40C8R7_9PEZI|nr:hypothetical protein B0T17DRAFT_525380 [Bombardia bombarda]